MQYFNIKTSRDLTSPIVEKVGNIEVVQAYATQLTNGLTSVRGKSKGSAMQNAQRLGLIGAPKKQD